MENGQEVSCLLELSLACDSHEVVLSALRSEKGIACLPSYVVADGVCSDEFEILFESHMPESISIHAVVAQTVYVSPTVNALVEFMIKTISFERLV